MREAAGPKTWCRRCARWRKNSASGSRQTPAGTVSNNRARSGKVGTGFPKRSCSNKRLERDDDSKKSHPALGAALVVVQLGERCRDKLVQLLMGEILSGLRCFEGLAFRSRRFVRNRELFTQAIMVRCHCVPRNTDTNS